jgi:hypothetical protein
MNSVNRPRARGGSKASQGIGFRDGSVEVCRIVEKEHRFLSSQRFQDMKETVTGLVKVEMNRR